MHSTTFLLVRHAETDWNRDKIWYGTSNVSINENGRNQALILKKKLDEISFDHCLSSHLKRAYETASLLTELPIHIDQRLQERRSKLYDDIPHGTCIRGIKKEYEDPLIVSARIFECLEEAAKNYVNKTILVVTHGGIMKQILLDLLGTVPSEINIPNTATLQIHHTSNGWFVINPEIWDLH